MHKFGTYFDGFIKHVSDTGLHIRRIRVRHPNQDFEQIQRVPRMTLDVGGEGFDCGTCDRNIVDCHDSMTWELYEIEGVWGKREKGIKQP